LSSSIGKLRLEGVVMHSQTTLIIIP
jgi:hypothetical protein